MPRWAFSDILVEGKGCGNEERMDKMGKSEEWECRSRARGI